MRSVELFEKPELKFNGGQYVTIKDEKYKQAIKYFFADESVLVTPSKTIELPDRYVTFQFTKEKFERLMKGANSLALPDIALKGENGVMTITASDKKNTSSNEYSVELVKLIKLLLFTLEWKTSNKLKMTMMSQSHKKYSTFHQK